jgi:hypothetical protein
MESFAVHLRVGWATRACSSEASARASFATLRALLLRIFGTRSR